MIVTFIPSQTDFDYTENQNITLDFSWTAVLSPEEILELEDPENIDMEPNEIVTKTFRINPTSQNINYIESSNGWTVSGSFNLDDFNANIHYVSKGSSDKLETPQISTKYSLVPDNKDIFRINPIETSKTFVVTISLKDKKDVFYNKTYNINIKINNNSISNWTRNYFQERY